MVYKGDLTGTNDNSYVITRDQFANEEFLKTYVHPSETPMIYLKCGVRDLVFTDKSLIISAKNASVSTKRILSRLDYASSPIAGVDLTLAGLGTDRDIELTFSIGSVSFEGPNKIDIWKTDTSKAVDVFHCLNKIATEQKKRANIFQLCQNSQKLTLEEAEVAGNNLYASYASIIQPYTH